MDLAANESNKIHKIRRFCLIVLEARQKLLGAVNFRSHQLCDARFVVCSAVCTSTKRNVLTRAGTSAPALHNRESRATSGAATQNRDTVFHSRQRRLGLDAS